MMNRAAKTAWQRERRALLALAAGREPHRTGRPPTGRRDKHHGDRAAQRARARERLIRSRGDNGCPVADHPLLLRARAIVARHVKADHGAVQYQPLHEDAVGEAALALVAGEDAEAAARRFVRRERAWLAVTAPLTAGRLT